MFPGFLNRLFGATKPSTFRFEPLYSLDQMRAIGRMPIVQVLPFTTEVASFAGGAIRTGVGALLANLLRRNLLLTRQVSVIGIEDTSRYSWPDDSQIDFANWTNGNCDILIAGHLKAMSSSETLLEIQMCDPSPERAQRFRIRIPHDRVTAAMNLVASESVRRLGFDLPGEIQEMWRSAKVVNWKNLCLAAKCCDDNDLSKLAELLKSGHIHADAVALLHDFDDKELCRTTLATAIQQDPLNAQLLFFYFISIWKGNTRCQPEASELLRRALYHSPGHGKSHMCLPHVTPQSPENWPYILAHSEIGYQLLRTNAFALNNFCSYLQEYSPDDPRIRQLFLDAIHLDPDSPFGFRDAIEYLLSRRKPFEALEFAQALLRLCTPPVAERTIYCLRQNPAVDAMLDNGELTAMQYAQRYVDECRAALGHE